MIRQGFARREVRDGGNGYVSVEVPLGDRDGDRRRPRKLFAKRVEVRFAGSQKFKKLQTAIFTCLRYASTIPKYFYASLGELP